MTIQELRNWLIERGFEPGESGEAPKMYVHKGTGKEVIAHIKKRGRVLRVIREMDHCQSIVRLFYPIGYRPQKWEIIISDALIRNLTINSEGRIYWKNK